MSTNDLCKKRWCINCWLTHGMIHWFIFSSIRLLCGRKHNIYCWFSLVHNINLVHTVSLGAYCYMYIQFVNVYILLIDIPTTICRIILCFDLVYLNTVLYNLVILISIFLIFVNFGIVFFLEYACAHTKNRFTPELSHIKWSTTICEYYRKRAKCTRWRENNMCKMKMKHRERERERHGVRN